jgi:hypothetical protein
MQFTLNVTGYGTQFFDDAGGSSPFSGFFEITKVAAQ